MDQLSQFITNHWQLWLIFIIILILTLINELLTQKKKAKQVTPQTAVSMHNQGHAVIVDLRDKESYKAGHIIDSINVPEENLDSTKMTQYKNKSIILVCARGSQSSAAAAKIRTQGYQALILGGGIAAWQNAGLPLVKGR